MTKLLLEIVTSQKHAGFKQIDAPLRHVFVTNNGFKMVDHVYSFSRIQERPLELFQNLEERGFLDAFLEHVKVLDPDYTCGLDKNTDSITMRKHNWR